MWIFWSKKKCLCFLKKELSNNNRQKKRFFDSRSTSKEQSRRRSSSARRPRKSSIRRPTAEERDTVFNRLYESKTKHRSKIFRTSEEEELSNACSFKPNLSHTNKYDRSFRVSKLKVRKTGYSNKCLQKIVKKALVLLKVVLTVRLWGVETLQS